MSAVETLVQEHRLISRMVKLLPVMRRNIDAGLVDEEVLSDVTDFFSAFTDGCHHAKEEDLLFPMLQKRGVSSKGCPVGTLKLEHQQGRNIARALNSAVKKYEGGDANAANTISAILKDATELYTDHIWREDYLLFPMSEKVLLGTDLETLVKDFAEVQTQFGSVFQEKYERLVDRLEKELVQTSVLLHEDAEGLSSSATPTEAPACRCHR